MEIRQISSRAVTAARRQGLAPRIIAPSVNALAGEMQVQVSYLRGTDIPDGKGRDSANQQVS